MSGKIHILSEDIRNKISAGEVVERPASVVKELMENSLDSGASELTITVENGGHTLIQVLDNGNGISPDDLPLAVQRYTTSKIQNVSDLFQIDTLGFRGEALSSIASVSEMVLHSCDGDHSGGKVIVKDGIISDTEPAPDIDGTQISIRSLFYNTPARRKFLKSPKVELRKIVETVRQLSLGNPESNVTLIADGKTLLQTQNEDLTERINSLFDPTYGENLLPVSMDKGDFNIKGFIGNLNLVRSRPGEQFIFLNSRFIKDRLLNSAVYSGFQSLVKRGEYPFFVLNITIPVDQVDVNVHPMKTEVRFKDEWRIYHVIKAAVMESLKEILDTVPSFERGKSSFLFNTGQQTDSFPFQNKPPEGYGGVSNGHSHVPFMENKDQNSELEKAKNYASVLAEKREDMDPLTSGKIWQIHDKYILSPIQSGMVVIDQHVAHERVLFEEALRAFEKNHLPSQTLLFPEEMTFSPDEYSVLLDLLPYLEKIGFRLKEGDNSNIMLEAVPSDMSLGNEKTIIRNILDHYLEHGKEYSSTQERLAASYACHGAIKAGDPLTFEEMQELVSRLFATEHPYYCPHGRPIIVRLSLEELDKRFERI
jgi:DNA mismatch repair protein MutL